MIIKKGDNITVIGRRWFERVNGNTYHSVKVYLNGALIGRNDFEYGYGDHYQTTAGEIIINNILKEDYKTGGFDSRYSILRELKDKGVTIVSSVTDVTRKGDL